MCKLSYIDRFQAEFKVLGKFSNQYRELPLVIKRSICDVFNYEYKWVENEIKGKFPNKCPVKKVLKSTYHLFNWYEQHRKYIQIYTVY